MRKLLILPFLIIVSLCNGQGILSPPAVPIARDATSAQVVQVDTNKVALWGDSMTQSGGTQLDPITGLPSIPYGTYLTQKSGYFTYNGGIAGETAQQIKARVLAATDKYGWSTIIWAGRNNITTQTAAQIKASVDSIYAIPTNPSKLVVGIVNATNEHSGSANYNKIIAVNALLAATYGSRYVPIREYLVSLYNPANPTDVYNHGNDCPPSSLHAINDSLHLNSTANNYIAQYINDNYLSQIKVAITKKTLTTDNLLALSGSMGYIGAMNPNYGDFTRIIALPSGFGDNSVTGIRLKNQTLASAAVPRQRSPILDLVGEAWNSSLLTSQTIRFAHQIIPVNGSAPSGIYTIGATRNNAAPNDILRINADGLISVGFNTPLPSANQIISTNTGNSSNEYRSLTGGTGITITPASGSFTFAVNQAFTPTWTGLHTFTNSTITSRNVADATAVATFNQANASGTGKLIDAQNLGSSVFSVDKTGAVTMANGFTTSNIVSTTANLTVLGGNTPFNTGNAQMQSLGATNTGFRVAVNGGTTGALNANGNYGNLIVGSSPITTGSSGTHAAIANLMVNPVGIVTSGGAGVGWLGSAYIQGNASSGNNSWFKYGVTKATLFRGDSLVSANTLIKANANKDFVSATAGVDYLAATDTTVFSPKAYVGAGYYTQTGQRHWVNTQRFAGNILMAQGNPILFSGGAFNGSLNGPFTLSSSKSWSLPDESGTIALGFKLRLTGSGTGAATTISIPHGLTSITSNSIAVVTPINAASAGISYVTTDATNLNIIYTVAPANGTNNLSYNVSIKP